ncbi:transcription initiation factor IIB [Thermofilum pendens]
MKPILNFETGEYACPYCGYVFPESLLFTGRSARSKEEFARKVHDYPVSRGIDTTPQEISEKYKRAYYESLGKERKSASYLREVESMAKSMNLPPHLIEEVKEYFTKVQKEGLLRGRNRKAVAAAIIYYVCSKEKNVSVSLKDLEGVAGVSENDVKKAYRVLLKKGVFELGQPHVSKPSKYVYKIVGSHELQEVRSNIQLKLLADFADSLGNLLQGKKPRGIAAAAVYIIANLLGYRKTQSLIAKIAGVSTLTLRRVVKEIDENLDIYIEI